MSTSGKKFGPLGLTLCLLLAGFAVSFAQRQFALVQSGRPEVKILMHGSVERDGGFVTLDKVENVRRGEILHWDITSLNEGTAEARELKAIGHIPKGTVFIAGSASAPTGSTVTYSIDGGKTFSTLPIIEEEQPDGSRKKVPAPVSMYTQVQYEWVDPLAAGGKLNASYKLRVR